MNCIILSCCLCKIGPQTAGAHSFVHPQGFVIAEWQGDCLCLSALRQFWYGMEPIGVVIWYVMEPIGAGRWDSAWEGIAEVPDLTCSPQSISQTAEGFLIPF